MMTKDLAEQTDVESGKGSGKGTESTGETVLCQTNETEHSRTFPPQILAYCQNGKWKLEISGGFQSRWHNR